MEENDKYEGVAADQATPGDQQEIEALKKDRDNLYDRLLRKQAEFENYKKRMDREKSETSSRLTPSGGTDHAG